MNLLLLLISLLFGPIEEKTIKIKRGTTYNAHVSQCDSDPYGTADGSRIDPIKLRNKELRWVALSRDLINCPWRQTYYPYTGHWQGPISWGDTIIVNSISSPQINGKWVVHDCMNRKYSKSIDFLFDPKNNKPKLGVCRDITITLLK